MITLTRRYRFSASHRLHLGSLTEEQNWQLYGKCNNPYGHGHDYVLEITCGGALDCRTGLLISTTALDRLVDENVVRLFAFRNINQEIAEFQDLVPTTENIALVIAQRLQNKWHPTMGVAQLKRVHVQETDRNGFEVLVGAAAFRQQSQLARPDLDTVSHA